MTAKKFGDETIYNQVIKLHYDLEKHHFGKLNQRDATTINQVTKELLVIGNDLYAARKEIAAEVARLKAENEAMREALEKIRDKAKSWEGRKEAPYWNLGDIAAGTLKRLRAALGGE